MQRIKQHWAKVAAAICFCVAVAFSLPAGAQVTTAAVHGTVKDPTGAVIPGATVTALNTSTGISSTVTTNGSGYYIFTQLHIGGPYTISIDKTGFKSFQSTGLMLNLNDNREIDARMALGTTSQTVQVTTSAVQVETSDTQLKTLVSGSEIVEMPLLGRDATELEKSAPGVVESSDRFGTFSADGNQTQTNSYLLDGADVNDAPLQQNGVTPSPDALAEFDVVTSTLNPEFSRNSGAIMNAAIKSGTNKFHGDAFEFYRDTFMNNGNYFSKVRPVFHQNLFGATLGGPIYKDHTFFFLSYQGYRNRTAVTQLTPVPATGELSSGNFSNDTEPVTGDLDSTGLSSNAIPFAMQGPNGTCAAGTPWDQCFPVNAQGQVIIPTSNYNSIASALANEYVPAPNQVIAGTSYYNFNPLSSAGDDQGIIRIDEQLTKQDELWASTIFESNPTSSALPFDGADLNGFGEVNAAHTKIFNAAWTHTFNPNLLNDLHAGYYRFNFSAVNPATVVQPSSLGFDITPQDAAAAGAPYIGLTGWFVLGFSEFGPQPRKDENYDFIDNLTYTKGNHSMKYGAHVEKFVVSNPFYSQNNGNYTFAGSGTFSSGDPLIDYMLGIPDSYVQSTGGFIDARAWEYYFYVQDNWKVSDTLTLNYGTGWDTETPWENLQYGGEGIFCWQASNVQSTVFPNAPPGLLYPGDTGCNRNGGATTKYDHLGPRVGFAWSPDSGMGFLTGTPGTHQFAVRGGFGIYYNRDSEEGSLQNLEDAPFGLTSLGAGDIGGSPSFANPYNDVANRPGLSEANKFPYTFPTPGQSVPASTFLNEEPLDINSISPNYDVPYVYNYNLNIQRELPSNMVMTIGYVGNLGRKLVRAYEADRVTPAGHAACLSNPACSGSNRVFATYFFPSMLTQPGTNVNGIPYYLSVGRQYTDGSSNYNSLQVQLVKNTTHGLYFNLAYTYSHGLDNASGLESSGFNGLGTNWVPGFQYLSYGDSDYDARHRFSAYYIYQIPIFHSWNDNKYVREALGGWVFTGTTALQTGFPIPMYESGTNNSLYCNYFSYYSCPDTPETSTFHIPTLNPRRPGNYWFNNSVFSPEPLGTFGNVKRNFLHGPGFNYSDFTLQKNVYLGGEQSSRYFQMRIEAYNAFNHANFASPNNNFSAGPQFGQITSVVFTAASGGAGDPQPGRVVQLVGKIVF